MNEYRERIVNTIEICDDDINELYKGKTFDGDIDDLEYDNQNDGLYDFSDSVFENKPRYKVKESITTILIHIVLFIIVYIFYLNNTERNHIVFLLGIFISLVSSSLVSFMTYYISEYLQRKKQWKSDVNHALKSKSKLLYEALNNIDDFRIFLKGYNGESINDIKNTIENQELYINYLIGFINYLVKNKYIISVTKSINDDIRKIKQKVEEMKKNIRSGIDANIFDEFKKIHNTACVLAGSLYLGYCEKFVENNNVINYKI